MIGEAVKGLPADWESNKPGVRWADIAGLRDVLIHGYHRVRVNRVWSVIEHDLPPLQTAIEDLLRSTGEDA